MSKNISYILIIIALIVSTLFLKSNIDKRVNTEIEITDNESYPTVAQREDGETIVQELVSGENKYELSAILIKDPEKLHLYPNFAEKLTSDEAIIEHRCASITSGGLYTKESTPIGLFIAEGKQLKSKTQSSFFNGIFSQTFDGKPSIGKEFVGNNIKISIQSGPILITNGQVQTFEKRNDEEARRVAIGITQNNEIVLMALYEKDSVFMGPTLNELPELIQEFSKNKELNIYSALNLDGGSASAFISDPIALSELSPVGSYFCVK